MATEHRRLYPYGRQTFSNVIEEGLVYVDKTEYVYKLVNEGPPYVFLNRPRGFGKTLFTSTLYSYFEGKRELFKGLAIEKLEKDWTVWSILYFNTSWGVFGSEEDLENRLKYELTKNAERFGIDDLREGGGTGLMELIYQVRKKTGQRVVVLIDGYDKPLIDFEIAQEVRDKLKRILMNFYVPLKSYGEHIHFIFMSGMTRLALADIFGGLNNMYNISMHRKYAGAFGITTEELEGQLSPDVDILAQKLGVTRAETLRLLNAYYGGYHFTWPSPDVLDPYGLLAAFDRGAIRPYRTGAVTPTYILDIIRENGIMIEDFYGEYDSSSIDAPAERISDATPFFYQSGTTTIRGCERDIFPLYTIGLPNMEVRVNLSERIFDNYVERSWEVMQDVNDVYDLIYDGDTEGAMKRLQESVGGMTYRYDTREKKNVVQLLYIIFMLWGSNDGVEPFYSYGMSVVVLKTKNNTFCQIGLNPEQAHPLMDEKELEAYLVPYAATGLPTVKVTVNTDTEKQTITGWQTESA